MQMLLEAGADMKARDKVRRHLLEGLGDLAARNLLFICSWGCDTLPSETGPGE